MQQLQHTPSGTSNLNATLKSPLDWPMLAFTSWDNNKLILHVVLPIVLVLNLWAGQEWLHRALSSVFDIYLRKTQAIFNDDKIPGELPSAPWVWPNGQGNMAKFVHGKENSLRWRQQYGSIFRIWSGMNSEIVLTESEHVKSVFRDSNFHTKAVDNNSGYFMQRLLGSCMGLISKSSWQSVRRVFNPPFAFAMGKDYTQLVTDEVAKHLRSISSEIIENGNFDPVADFKMLPFTIIAKILYGDLSAQSLSELHSLIPLREHLFGYVLKGGIISFSWARWLPYPQIQAAYRELTDFEKRWKAFNKTALAEAKARQLGSKNEPPAPIIALYDSVSQGTLSLPEMLQTLDEILFANLDVTMSAISWALVYQAAHPQVQQKLRDEHAFLTQSRQSNGRPSESSDEHKKALQDYLLSSNTYLHACVLEAARLRPLAAFSVAQSAGTERVLAGYRIPAGTSCVVDTHALNIRNPFWGVDASIFRPERFLERRSDLDLRYNYWRFGFGPRQCLGKHIGDLMIHTILLFWINTFELSIQSDKEEWKRNLEVWITQPVLKIHCQRRE